MIRELVEEKTPKVLKDLEAYSESWRVHYALFARRGFAAAARTYAEERQTLLVDLAQFDNGLQGAG